MQPVNAVAAWWSYAEADRTALGVVVVVMAIAALVVVGTRLWHRWRRRR